MMKPADFGAHQKRRKILKNTRNYDIVRLHNELTLPALRKFEQSAPSVSRKLVKIPPP